MIPQVNQSIVVCFRNQNVIEGTVVSWSDKVSVIKSSQSNIVILNTSQDVMYYQLSDFKNDYDKLRAKPEKTPNDIKTIAELKAELNEIERKEIALKLTEQKITKEVGLTQYGTFLPSNIKHTNKEITAKDNGFESTLSDLFKK